MKPNVFYMWNFKPNENQKIPTKFIKYNEPFFKPLFIEPKDILNLVRENVHLNEIWNKIPWWIVKADIGRLLLVYNLGGFYLDIDCVVKKNFLKFLKNDEIVLFIEHICNSVNELGRRENKNPERVTRIANYAFGSLKPKHPFIGDLINESIKRLNMILKENNDSIVNEDILWIAGPDVITSIYHDNRKKYNNIKLFDQSYILHGAWGTWRL